MRGYRVAIMDGPAVGWGYVTAIEPDPVIAVAPMPAGASEVHGRWMRVVVGDEWAGVRRYRREPLPAAEDVSLGPDDDMMCPYRVIE